MAGPWEQYQADARGAETSPVSGAPWEAYAAPKPRGVVDKLTGETGDRYQTWPERALRELVGTPERAITAAASAPSGSREATEAMIGPAADTALAISGTSGTRFPRIAGPPKVAPPTVAELKTESRAGYNSPEVAAVEVKPQPVADLSTKIESDLASRGFRPRPNQGAPVFDEVRDLVPPQGVSSVKVADLHSARKALGEIAKEVDTVGKPTSNAAAATIAKKHLDDFLPNIQQADVIAGDAAKAAQIMKEADANWAAAKRAENVDLQLTRADRQAAKSGTGSNIENSMRQKIAAMLDNPRRTVGFSDAEKQAMESIVRGTPTRNALRKFGKLGVDGGLSMLLHAGGALETGGATVPLAIGGTVARKLGEHLTSRAGTGLSEMVRSRSPLAAGNAGTTAVAHALTRRTPRAQASIPYAAIVSALMQPQHQGTR